VDVPEDAELIDAAGTWVLPGFIDAHAHLGVHEEGEGWSGNDTNEMTDPNGARFRAIDGIDPYEVGFDDALAATVEWYRTHDAWWKPIKSGAFRQYYQAQYTAR